MSEVILAGPPRVLNIGAGNGTLVFVEYRDRRGAVRDHLIREGWGARSATVSSCLTSRRQSDDVEVDVDHEEFRDAFASIILGEDDAQEWLEALGFSVEIVPEPTYPFEISPKKGRVSSRSESALD